MYLSHPVPPRLNRMLILMFTLNGILCSTAFAGPKLHLSNVRFETQENQVLITYDLTGQADLEDHEVSLILKRERDTSFQYIPARQTVKGDIGAGWFAGYNRRIIWEMEKEFPDGLYGDDFYFEVHVNPLKPGAARTGLWKIGAGAALVGGSVFAIKAVTGSGSGSAALPPPPGRP